MLEYTRTELTLEHDERWNNREQKEEIGNGVHIYMNIKPLKRIMLNYSYILIEEWEVSPLTLFFAIVVKFFCTGGKMYPDFQTLLFKYGYQRMLRTLKPTWSPRRPRPRRQIPLYKYLRILLERYCWNLQDGDEEDWPNCQRKCELLVYSLHETGNIW